MLPRDYLLQICSFIRDKRTASNIIIAILVNKYLASYENLYNLFPNVWFFSYLSHNKILVVYVKENKEPKLYENDFMIDYRYIYELKIGGYKITHLEHINLDLLPNLKYLCLNHVNLHQVKN